MRAYSQDLRQKVVAAVGQGVGVAEAARRFLVSRRWVTELWRRHRAGEDLGPRYAGRCGRPRRFTVRHEAQMRADVARWPDATCQDRVTRLSLPIQAGQVGVWLRRLNITRKKRP